MGDAFRVLVVFGVVVFTSFIVLVFFSSQLGLDAGAGNVGGAAFSSIASVPAGFAPPWNVFDDKDFLAVRVNSSSSIVSLLVAVNHSNMAFYRTFYVSENLSGLRWVAYNFTESPVAGDYILSAASRTLSLPTSALSAENWVIVYACVNDSGWQCGCFSPSDASCGLWSIQEFAISSVGCLNASACAGRDAGNRWCAEGVSRSCVLGADGCLDLNETSCANGCVVGNCVACTPGSVRSCYDGPLGTAGVGLCHNGSQTCSEGSFSSCVGEVLPSVEVCGNNLDDDCDGLVDENCSSTCQFSLDSDYSLFFDSSDQGCLGRPSIPRAFYPSLFTYHGTTFLGMSNGNQLLVYGLDDPSNPNLLTKSSFPVRHEGDSDYDLTAYVICDECRYAFFPYKVQGVFADLGDPASKETPSFTNSVVNYSVQGNGGFTFKSGSTQYLITDGLTDQCQGSALFIFNSINPQTIKSNFVDCINTDTGSGIWVRGGLYLQDPAYNGGTPYLWLASGTSSTVYAFRVDGSGLNVNLHYVQRLDNLYSVSIGSHTLGVAVDLERGIAMSITPAHGLVFWNFSDHDLSNPQQVLTRTDITGSNVAYHYPLLWTTHLFSGGEVARTFQVSGDASHPLLEDIANPSGSDMDFWDPSQPWNNLSCNPQYFGTTFSPDGRNLYVARKSEAQAFGLTCSSTG